MTEVTISEITADDWAAWKALRLYALREASFAFGSRYEDWKDAAESRWRDRLLIPGALNLVAEVDGRHVGMASGVPGDRPGRSELISMWVDPAARGRGVGDALIDTIVRWASPRSQELLLGVVPENAPAIALYRRHGFEVVDEPGDPLPYGTGTELLMRKTLDTSPV